jgi:hypothetical protein
MLPLDLPPFPEITSLIQELPKQTEPVVVRTSQLRLYLWANSDNSSKNAWVPDVPRQHGLPPWLPVLLKYWDNGTPIEYTLTMRHFWRQVPHTFTHILPGGQFHKTYTTSHGISTTDSHSISAEMGVEAGGLGAKISATFSHSVTVSDEKAEQTQFSAGAPKDGHTRVWVLWQLIDEIVALDPAGNVIPKGEAQLNRKGEVEWMSSFLGQHSGAFLSYPNPRQEFPSTTFMPQQADFPTT